MSSTTSRCIRAVCRAVTPAATSKPARPQLVGQVAGTHDRVDPQQFAIMGRRLRRQGQAAAPVVMPPPATALPQRPRAKLLDRGPLLLQEPPGFVLLALQTRLLGLVETAVLVQQVMLLDGPGDDPDQVPRGAGSTQT